MFVSTESSELPCKCDVVWTEKCCVCVGGHYVLRDDEDFGSSFLVSETCRQPCRGYNTGGSWRTAGLGMSREGSNTFDTGILSGGNIVSSM